jgi:molybdopterin/thiamine biosynthesis adenylyltransferase/molybdopterin synthase catalytic subunit/rhodanese-related sulfurtransferase
MMRPFSFSTTALEPERYRDALAEAACGGYASFEGWVRNLNEGRRVHRLEYEAFVALALKEGERIVQEAIGKFGVARAACVHRLGDLAVGELAVWVGVSAAHRDEAFAACRYVIDEVKHRVPIWKKEHYEDGDSGWVNCERCAEHAHGGAHSTVRHDGGASQEHFSHDYSRQMALPEVGDAGQARLRSAAVLVVGAGGLGVPVLQYLAAAGVGHLTVVDGDAVELSNLHRQPLYGLADVGRPKAAAAAAALARLNGDVQIEAVEAYADASNVDALLARHDLVVECTDNLRAKFLVNDAAVRAARPAVFASVHQYEGQLQAYLPMPDWPCLRCLWPEAPRDGLVGNCATAGVLGPVPGTLGALQAMLALRILLGIGPAPARGIVAVDLLTQATSTLRAGRDPDCDHEHGMLRQPREADGGPQDEPLELHFATLDEARAAGFMLVDVRETWERRFDRPGLDTGLHLPLSDLVNGRSMFPERGRHLLVCAHGVRSLALTERLRQQGRAGVYSMRGGLAALHG